MSRVGLLVVALLALAVRVGYEVRLGSDEGPAGALSSHLLGDERAYDALARSFARGEVDRERSFYQEPFYAWLLGRLYAAWPPAPLAPEAAVVPHDAVHRAVLSAQHVLGVLVALLTATLGARALSPRAGLLAGLLAALSGPLVFHEATLEKSALSLVVLLAAAHLWLDLLAGRGRWPVRALLLGLALGLGIHLRGNLYLLLGMALLSLLVPLGSARRRPAAAALVLLAALAVLAPLTLHNLRRGELVLTTYQAAPNVAIGQPPNDSVLDGVIYAPLRAGRGDARYEEADAVALAEEAAGRRLSGPEVSEHWKRVVRERVAERPGVALARAGLKVAHLFAGAEVVDVKAWDTMAEAVPWLATPLSDMRLAGPLALLGLLLLPWRRRPGLLVVRSIVLVVGVTLALFYVMGRYRLTAAPALWILAAGALDAGLAVLRSRRPLPVKAAVVLAGVAVPLLYHLFPPPPRVDSRPVALANASTIARAAALAAEDVETARFQRDRALGWADEAIGLAPMFESAHAAKLRALASGYVGLEPRSALARDQAWRLLLVMEGLRTGTDVSPLVRGSGMVWMENALALAERPSRPGGDALAGPLLAEACGHLGPYMRDQYQELGLQLLERALAFTPDDPELLAQRSLAHKRLGHLDLAEADARAALAAGLDTVELHNNFANILLDTGRPEEALQHLLRAEQLDPENRVVQRNLERIRGR